MVWSHLTFGGPMDLIESAIADASLSPRDTRPRPEWKGFKEETRLLAKDIVETFKENRLSENILNVSGAGLIGGGAAIVGSFFAGGLATQLFPALSANMAMMPMFASAAVAAGSLLVGFPTAGVVALYERFFDKEYKEEREYQKYKDQNDDRYYQEFKDSQNNKEEKPKTNEELAFQKSETFRSFKNTKKRTKLDIVKSIKNTKKAKKMISWIRPLRKGSTMPIPSSLSRPYPPQKLLVAAPSKLKPKSSSNPWVNR